MTIQPFLVVLFSLVASGVLALVVHLVRTVGDLKAILIGADGQNGVRGDVRQVKKDMKELHAAAAKITTVEYRVATMEQRLHDDVKRVCHDVESIRSDLRDAKDEWDGTERRRPRERP